ncbi:o-succinylbenzoate synthase [Listeria kieliensis]|uniref:o-succinylbenzoate synthase n=1 Tax=Listeria kieliensis TaxID=1621700 RepID=A0A3D8TL01_9LIST|nr:o-succinylbenzoate synthase [Listeria kieliensis]RDW99536.1 O-succinylbenzoate synthase [Listeria kieliensis]
MKLNKAFLYKVHLPLLTPFRTSYGLLREKSFYLIALEDELGNVGYGELEAFPLPDYTEETLEGAKKVVVSLLLEELRGKEIKCAEEVSEFFAWIRGNEMAKSSIESACYDLFAKRQKISLAHFIGAQRKEISVGVSIGIQKNERLLVEKVHAYVSAGYNRVKVKIKPGADFSYLKAIRDEFPELPILADANSAYEEKDLNELLKLDWLNITMIEQPFGVRDLWLHAKLQDKLEKVAVCLDENIRSLEDVKQAHAFGSCRAINLKMARVGGLREALRIAEFCKQTGMIVWCGGMLEAGVGRAYNVALAARNEFQFPGDISATSRYFKQDIVRHNFELVDGKICVPEGLGIGVEIDEQALKRFTESVETILLD